MVPDTRKPVTPMSQPSPSSTPSTPSSPPLSPDTAASAVDQAVASGGSYEVLAKRQDGQGQALEALEALERGAWDTLRGRNAATAIRERPGEKV